MTNSRDANSARKGWTVPALKNPDKGVTDLHGGFSSATDAMGETADS